MTFLVTALVLLGDLGMDIVGGSPGGCDEVRDERGRAGPGIDTCRRTDAGVGRITLSFKARADGLVHCIRARAPKMTQRLAQLVRDYAELEQQVKQLNIKLD